MNGVRVGSRLDQLLDLKRMVEVHIEAERRTPTRAAPRVIRPSSEAPSPPPQATGALAQVVRVPLTAVPHKTLRDWANANGYPQYPRGPVTADAIDAFIEAHR